MKRSFISVFLMLFMTVALNGCGKILLPNGRSPAPTLPAVANLTPTPLPSIVPASPSPTPSLSPAPTLSPTPTLTKTPTSTPTKTPSPTPTKTIAPTATPKSPVAVKLTVNSPYSVDVTGDGKKETVTVASKQNTMNLTVKNSSGKETTVSLKGDFITAYYYKNTSGKSGILLSLDEGSDDYCTVCYLLDGTTPKKSCTVTGYIQSLNGISVKLFDYAYVLGTWDTYRNYTMSSAFVLNPAGDKLWHVTGPNRQLTLKKDMKVQIKQNSTYTSVTLKKGAKIRISATDCKTYVLFTVADGRQGKLAITVKDTGVTIEGKPDDEWLDGILYIG